MLQNSYISDVVERDDLTAVAARKWHIPVDVDALVEFMTALALGDKPSEQWIHDTTDAYAADSIGNKLYALLSSKATPGPERARTALAPGAMARVLAVLWAGHWTAQPPTRAAPIPGDNSAVLLKFAELIDATVNEVRIALVGAQIRPGNEAYPVISQSLVAEWLLDHEAPPQADDHAIIAARAANHAERRSTLRRRLAPKAGGRVSNAQGRHADATLIAAAVSRSGASSVDLMRLATRRHALARALDSNLTDLKAIELDANAPGAPYITQPELVELLQKSPHIERLLNDRQQLHQAIGALLRWADRRVRSALATHDVVGRATADTDWRDVERVRYCLLRITQKRDRASHYRILLDDPWMHSALYGHAVEVTRNLKTYGDALDRLRRLDSEALESLAKAIWRDIDRATAQPRDDDYEADNRSATRPDRAEALNEAYVKIVEVVRAGPDSKRQREATARGNAELASNEYLFQSDWNNWCQSIVKTAMADPPQPDETLNDEHTRELETVNPRTSESSFTRLADQLVNAVTDLHCPVIHSTACCQGCLLAQLEQHAPYDVETPLNNALVDYPERPLDPFIKDWRERMSRLLALASLEDERFGDLARHLNQLDLTKRRNQIGVLSLWMDPVRPCVRSRLALAEDASDLARRYADYEVFGVQDLVAATGVADDRSVRTLRSEFLKELESEDVELSLVYRWVRSDPADEFRWLSDSPVLSNALEPRLEWARREVGGGNDE